MTHSVEAIVITGLIGAVGLGIGLAFGLRDLRTDGALLQRLAQGLDATRAGSALKGAFRRWRFTIRHGRNSRNALTSLRVMLHAHVPDEIIVQRSSGLQTLARTAGLTERALTGDAAFDRDFFVLARGDALSRCQMTAPERLQHIRRLFEAGISRLDYSAEHQAVVAEWSPFQGAKDWTGAQVAIALDHLGALVEPLPTQAVASTFTTPRTEVKAFLPAYMLVLLLFAAGTLLAITCDKHYPPMDRSAVFAASLGLSVPGLLLFAYVTRRALLRNLEGYRYWIGLVLIAALAFPISGYAAVVYCNGAGAEVRQGHSVQQGALGFSWTLEPLSAQPEVGAAGPR